ISVDSKALKMALYGFLISAPLGHVLVGALQKAVAGRTGARVKIAQVIASNVLVAPIQVAVYLASVAALNNAPSFERILKTVRAGFMPVLRIQWIVSPLSMAVAQNFLPVELWVPFFNLVQFVIGTYFNVQAKK
ncbi:integral membrane protein, partial [Fistulina hepatica ATCC 64428]